MSINTQDRGITVATGHAVVTDEDTAEVRAVGIAEFSQPDAGELEMVLVQPVDASEIHVLAFSDSSFDAKITALPDPADPSRLTFFAWDAAGDPLKAVSFWFTVKRLAGGAVTVADGS